MDTKIDCADLDCAEVGSDQTFCGVGECAGNTGNIICHNGSRVDTCDPLAGAEPEDCSDGLDNDCNGSTDYDDPSCQQCINGETRLCAVQYGVCEGSEEVCAGYQWPGCDYSGLAGYETIEDTCADGLDNDCDGLTDCDDHECTLKPLCQEVGLTYFWLEGEGGVIGEPMQALWDVDASAGEYIVVPNGSGNVMDSGQAGGSAEYSFEVTEEGDYVVWGRVISNNVNDDSFFVSMDGGEYTLWDTLLGGVETWASDQVSERFGIDPVVYHLSVGVHTLIIKAREDGTKLDRILITNDSGYVPEGLGE